MFLMIQRTSKAALKSFLRNSWLSVATSGILTLTLYVIGVLMIISFSSNSIMQNIQQKANISIYFKPDVTEETIAKVKGKLESNTNIDLVEYVSREQALEDFKRNNASDCYNCIDWFPFLFFTGRENIEYTNNY
jgi:cell division transport system permease protein